jgi:hypothetical protein
MSKKQKASIIFIIAFCIICSFSTTTYAQANPDNYQAYLQSLSRFNDSRRTFETSRSRYFAFQTVQSRDTVIKDAHTMLTNGINTLGRYVGIVGNITARQRTVDEYATTKSLILEDLQIHAGFLLNLANTLPANPTLEEINAYSESLTTRYGYVRTTVLQASMYYDLLAMLDQVAQLKTLLADFDGFLLQFPTDNSKANLLKQNILNHNSKVILQETSLYKLLQSIYPQPATTQSQPSASPSPAFQGSLAFNPESVATIRGELNNILNSLKQDINSAREVYKEL